jgi:hypothetical protein
VEDEPDAVLVSVRDDGPGISEGRLAAAEHEGRLGVAQSIRGRLRDLGGTAVVESVPGQGTEVELRLPRGRPAGPSGLPEPVPEAEPVLQAGAAPVPAPASHAGPVPRAAPPTVPLLSEADGGSTA